MPVGLFLPGPGPYSPQHPERGTNIRDAPWARRFRSTAGDQVTAAIGSVGVFGAGTVAAIVKVDSGTPSNWTFTAGTGANWGLYVGANRVNFYDGAAETASPATPSLVGQIWYLVAFTKPTGSSVGRFHIYNYATGVWTHAVGNSTVADSAAPSTSCYIGGYGTASFDGVIQTVGYWNSELSDGSIETLPLVLTAWQALAPTALWSLSQADTATPVADIAGAADETALVGTAVILGNPDWDDTESVGGVANVPLATAAGVSDATLALTAPLLPAYQTYALSLSPSLYWALNATTGTTDQSGNGRNGTGQGGVSVGANATSPLNGGSASTDLDGGDDYVTSTYSPYTNGTTRTFTGWSYRDTSSTDDALMGGTTSFAASPLLRINSGSTDILFMPTVGGLDSSWTGAWPGNTQWVHWALVFNETTDAVELFINGVSQGALSNASAYSTPGDIEFGASGAGSNSFDGKMAHVAVWERALTAVEIANLYASRLLPGIESLTSAGQSSATLALTAPAKVTLATSAAQSAATLALTAPAKVTLATSAAVSSATLALSAPTQVPLATAACVASATCAVSIPSAAVEVPLATAACQSSATLALSAPALTTLQSSAAVSSATLALSAPAKLALTAAAISSATLTLRAETRVTLATSAAQSAATLALTAPTRVVLGTAAATSAATLALSAPTRVVLGTSAAQSAATLSLTAPTRVTLGTAATTSSATLALTATTQIPLQTSAAVASATLGLTAGGAPVPLVTAAAQSSATLALSAQTRVVLGSVSANSAATLTLTAATKVTLAISAAQSSATLALTAVVRVTLTTSAATSSATLAVVTHAQIPLGTAAAQSSATLALAAATRVVLQSAAGVLTASLSSVYLEATPDTNPDLGGDVEENATGGEVEEVLTGGTPVANITGGVPVATVTSGIVNEVLTGGTYDEVLTGGEPDDTTGGDPDLVSTGGDVNVVLTGGVVNEVLTGGTYDEMLTGGEVQEVPTGDSPDESQRGGDYDLVLTGGEVL